MRKFAQYLILAQIASNAGKGFESPSDNADNVVRKNYLVKDNLIGQAISAAKDCRQVTVSKGYCDRTNMRVIYFDIGGYGQVSFHIHSNFKRVAWGGVWNRRPGESLRVCSKLNLKFNLGLALK